MKLQSVVKTRRADEWEIFYNVEKHEIYQIIENYWNDVIQGGEIIQHVDADEAHYIAANFYDDVITAYVVLVDYREDKSLALKFVFAASSNVYQDVPLEFLDIINDKDTVFSCKKWVEKAREHAGKNNYDSGIV